MARIAASAIFSLPPIPTARDLASRRSASFFAATCRFCLVIRSANSFACEIRLLIVVPWIVLAYVLAKQGCISTYSRVTDPLCIRSDGAVPLLLQSGGDFRGLRLPARISFDPRLPPHGGKLKERQGGGNQKPPRRGEQEETQNHSPEKVIR